jgi:hypothetical protein
VDFLRRWYSRSERRAYLEAIPTSDLRARQHLMAALDLSEASLSEPDRHGAFLRQSECEQFIEKKQFDKALDAIEEAIERAGKPGDADALVRPWQLPRGAKAPPGCSGEL